MLFGFICLWVFELYAATLSLVRVTSFEIEFSQEHDIVTSRNKKNIKEF